MYNLMSAAAAAGVNRSTVLRAIKAGRISAQRDSNNNWEIDPAEFHRVFPPLPSIAAASPQHDQQQTDGQVALLRNFVEQLRNDLVARRKITASARKTCGRNVTAGMTPSSLRNVNYPLQRNLMPWEATSRATDCNAPGAG